MHAFDPAAYPATVRDLLASRSGIYHLSAYMPRGMAEQTHQTRQGQQCQ